MCDLDKDEGKPEVDARQQAVMKAAELHKKFQEIVQWEAGKVCVYMCVCVCACVCTCAQSTMQWLDAVHC